MPYEAQFTMDAIICGLTLHRTYHLSRRRPTRARPGTDTDILSLMMRDGALYFGCVPRASRAQH